MLYICGIYAWLGSEDLAAYLRAIYSNLIVIFFISIYYIKSVDI